MKENFLFRETPRQATYDPQLPAVCQPIVAYVSKPIHRPSLVLGILALVLSVYFPLAAIILGIIGRVSGENHSIGYTVVGSKICCNAAFAFIGLYYLLTFLQLFLMYM